MNDAQTNARKTAQDAREKTSEELVAWPYERGTEDSYRRAFARLEFERRIAVAAQETAKSTRDSARYMLWSVIAIAVAAVISAGATLFSAWHLAH
jgi:hypothetical protein